MGPAPAYILVPAPFPAPLECGLFCATITTAMSCWVVVAAPCYRCPLVAPTADRQGNQTGCSSVLHRVCWHGVDVDDGFVRSWRQAWYGLLE